MQAETQVCEEPRIKWLLENDLDLLRIDSRVNTCLVTDSMRSLDDRKCQRASVNVSLMLQNLFLPTHTKPLRFSYMHLSKSSSRPSVWNIVVVYELPKTPICFR